MLRSALGYAAASRSIASGAAFESATKYLVENMLRSVTKKIEICMFYGQVGLGTVASTVGNVITIATAEWAPGIWSGAEKMPIQIRDITGATVRGNCNIAAVDLDNLAISVDLLPAGVVATDIIWFQTGYGNEFAGVHKIITNVGTLFNISASQYSLWKGNIYPAGAAQLSLSKIEHAIALAVAKGLDDDVTVFVNPDGWADLLVEQAALRRYDGSYSMSDLDNGSKAIMFYGQNGKISIEPSIYVKQGYAYILDMRELCRVGSTDVTFERPGMPGKFFRELENSAGYELRLFSDMALFCSAPGKLVLINGVVNAA